MTPEEALQLLDAGCSRLSSDRQTHVNFQLAVQCLSAELKKWEKDDDKGAED